MHCACQLKYFVWKVFNESVRNGILDLYVRKHNTHSHYAGSLCIRCRRKAIHIVVLLSACSGSNSIRSSRLISHSLCTMSCALSLRVLVSPSLYPFNSSLNGTRWIRWTHTHIRLFVRLCLLENRTNNESLFFGLHVYVYDANILYAVVVLYLLFTSVSSRRRLCVSVCSCVCGASQRVNALMSNILSLCLFVQSSVRAATMGALWCCCCSTTTICSKMIVQLAIAHKILHTENATCISR